LNTNESKELAKYILDNLNLKPGFDIAKLIKEFGGEIERTYQSHDIGCYVVKENRGFKMYLNSTYNERKQRFLIASQLGHLVMHMYYLDDYVWQNIKNLDSRVYRFGHDQQELEANEFASEFLMPEKEFKEMTVKFAKENYDGLIVNLSNYFKVSEKAILYRGHNLKLWVKNNY